MQSDLVIVVDDDDELRSLVSDILHTENYRVLDFSSPHGALQEICKGPVHEEILNGALPIIISDILMPGGSNGMDFLKEVRKGHPGIPFIFMTAFGGAEILNQAKELGANSFLRKPFSLTGLLEHLSNAQGVLKRTTGVEQGAV
ncbi:MAG: response regulator [Bdellovibrionota bacterium]